MSLPFSRSEFFFVFHQYNLAVNGIVWMIYALGLFAIWSLWTDQRSANKIMFSYLSFLWLWMGVAYHWTFFARINPAAWIFGAFFILESFLLVGGVRQNWTLQFSPAKSARGIFQIACLLYALLIYPLLGIAMGHAYPNGPIFGLPCPSTILTFAILSALRAETRKLLAVSFIPVIWSLIGTIAATSLGVYEDYALILSAIGYVLLAWNSITTPSYRGRAADSTASKSRRIVP